MLKPVTKKFTDESANGVYMFTFYCDICEKSYKSVPYQSETDLITTDTRELEHIAAYERANRDAIKNFNRCPVCDKIVCDVCFRFLHESDMCKVCANSRGGGDKHNNRQD